MTVHKEKSFETEICDHLSGNGWLYAEGDAALYDRKHALYPPDLVEWIKDTQPKAWETISKTQGTKTVEHLCARIRDSIEKRGTLDVIRNGVEILGLRHTLDLSQFRPANTMNKDILKKYSANRLRVIRQVHYSLHCENSLDLVLFLNGIPLATLELKTDFTQSVQDAVDQYRFDRLPKAKGKNSTEPLLSFPGGALVHFAVSNMEVYMTTHLEGSASRFIPFNKGDHGGAGNPADDQCGHRTAYLWKEVFQRDSWLEIIGRYVIARKDKKKHITGIIFPRYHQLDVARALVSAIKADGAGRKYLIQHSAGSGKTNSIAWTSHFLADLHNEKNEKIFNTVLVVSDRNVIDAQLQEAVFDFERNTGVVATVKGEGDSKSKELATALSGGKKIVICTIQTFPFAIKKVQELSATQGKQFAVIADEAHSSQTGEAAAKLREVLSAEEIKEIEDGGEISTEDILAAQMKGRASTSGITYVAFTATPKGKTMELFGTLPHPGEPPGEGNMPAPFHVYSMRQAIEEGFILDVLKNYTSYKMAFKLAHNGKDFDEKSVEKNKAMKGIMGWVRLHDYNISQKVQVVVEHFRGNIAPLLGGKAKAMVVVGSRKEAVRWKVAIEKYIKDNNYRIGTLVAFSGKVDDSDTGPEPFSESSVSMNPNLKGRDIREAFKGEEYQILLVANKFQTGFDQALLCGMYIDKKLAGIQAVQTISRLNRAHPGKDTTYVLDFVNDTDDILTAFRTYYTTAELSDVSDPNLVLNLREKLDATGHYDSFEVNRVVNVETNPASKQSDLINAMEPVISRIMLRYREARDRKKAALASGNEKEVKDATDEMNELILFKKDIATYVRIYTFLSQIFDYGNTEIEKRYIFFKLLLPLIEYGREREEIDFSKVVLSHHNLKIRTSGDLPLPGGKKLKLKPPTDTGDGSVHEPDKVLLREIIAKVNELFEGELTEDDKLIYVNNVIKGKLLESNTLVRQASNNTKEQFSNSPDLMGKLMDAVMDSLEAHTIMSKQALDSEKVRNGLKAILLGPAQLYEALRERGELAS